MQELELYGEIGWDVSLKSFNRALKEKRNEFPEETLLLKINSVGGSVTEAFAIAHLIEVDGNIDTINIGIAASAAAFILLKGRNRYSAESSMTMLHKAWMFLAGNSSEMLKTAKILDEYDAELIKTIVANTLLGSADDVREMLEEPGLWLNSDNAIENGLMSKVLSDYKKQALPENSIKYIEKNYGNIPVNIFNQIITVSDNTSDDDMTDEQMKALAEAVGTTVANSVTEAVKPLIETINDSATKQSEAVDALKTEINALAASGADNTALNELVAKIEPALNALNESGEALKSSNESLTTVVAALGDTPANNQHTEGMYGLGEQNFVS